jgi:hypothetical protein
MNDSQVNLLFAFKNIELLLLWNNFMEFIKINNIGNKLNINMWNDDFTEVISIEIGDNIYIWISHEPDQTANTLYSFT